MTSGRWFTAIVVVGAALRFVPIWFGLPYVQTRPDETVALGLAASVRGGDLNPHFFHWPSLTIYVFAGLNAAASAIRRAFSIDPGLTFADQVVPARAFVAGAGTLTLVVLFRMARRMVNTTTGLLAAFFLAVSILHVRESHFAMTDALMTLLLTTSLAILLRAIDMDPADESADSRSGAIRWFAAAGFVGGLATSTKYSAAAVLAGVGAAQLYRLVRCGTPAWWPRTWLPSVAFGTAFLLGFVVATPYALLDFPAFEADLRFDMTHLAAGHGVNLGRGWQYHLTNSLPYGLGVPLFVAGLVGIWPLARYFPRQAIVLGAFAAGFYGLIGSGQTVFFRYVLPLVPILCLSAAVASERAARWIAARTSVTPLTAAAALGLLIGGMGLVNSVSFDVILSRTDSRVLAARWLAPRLRPEDSLWDSGGEYTRLDLSQVDFHPWAYDPNTESFGHPEGRTPDWLVLHESPLPMYTSVPAIIERLARSRYHLVRTVLATTRRPGSAVYDPQDAFFMPVSGFSTVRRPGPTIRIYRHREARPVPSDDRSPALTEDPNVER
jgi:Dolichyl-phosphate-mannose-protein mannosyltransferase